jgi:hypothetical protein
MRKSLLIVGLALLAGPVGAQQFPPAEQKAAVAAADQFEAVCGADCRKADQQCVASGKGAPACDTRAIACEYQCFINSTLYRSCARSGTTTPMGKNGLAAHCAAEVADNQARLRKAGEAPRALITFAGGDGRSTAAAISVVGTKNILEDIVAKRRWVQTRLPAGARHTGIERADSGGKSWDVMVARMPNGQPAKFYFNKYVDPARDAGK